MVSARLRGIRGLMRHINMRRSLVLGLATTALGGGVAMADTTFTDVINFNHAPEINESGQTGNYQIWGLGYAQIIIGAQGSNVIVGDGSCPAGSITTEYCSTAPFKGSKSAFIYANGAGANTIFSGYGPSIIFGGTGPNTITSAPTTSLIFGGNAGDTINANQGATVIYPGTGTNTIFAESPAGDDVFCSGKHDTVFAFRIDTISKCANVIYVPEPSGAMARERHARHYVVPSLRHNRRAREFYAKLKAAERKARHHKKEAHR